MFINDGQIIWWSVIFIYIVAVVFNIILFFPFVDLLSNELKGDEWLVILLRILLVAAILIPGSYLVLWIIGILGAVISIVGGEFIDFIKCGDQ